MHLSSKMARVFWLARHVGTRVIVLETVLVFACFVDSINPPLVQKSEEDDVVSQTHEAVLQGHLDHECKNVIDEGAENFVNKSPNGEMRHRLQLVVYVKLRRHGNKAEEIHRVCERRDEPGPPRFISIVKKTVDR